MNPVGVVDLDSSAEQNLVQVARLGLAGRREDLVAYVRRLARRARKAEPELSAALGQLVASEAASAFRNAGAAMRMPTDAESRLHLVRVEHPIVLDVEPVWNAKTLSTLNSTLQERNNAAALQAAGLQPTRSLLFTGPPGVGKTLAAKWLARELGQPLMTLDLSAVMSSLLGRTGNNVRAVLEYAKSVEGILLLDEFDAIAKRRDDGTEIGELKRLVTVLLQEVDGWPSSGLLIAATNHAELLDPAVWRRFERIVQFPLPSADALAATIQAHAGEVPVSGPVVGLASNAMSGRSHADAAGVMRRARRHAVLNGIDVDLALLQEIGDDVESLAPSVRLDVALNLVLAGVSRRQVAKLTRVSRDTMRRHMKEE